MTEWWLATVALVLLSGAIGFAAGAKLDRRSKAEWLVRPHTDRSLRDYSNPDDHVDQSTVKQAEWLRTSHPSSSSKMDR